ncbi:MAG: GGDEF domain-containing protein [Christensenellales bacterium]
MIRGDCTKEELLGRIEELELLNRELLAEKEQEVNLGFAWTGNLGHWYWNIKTNTVTFNPLKVTALGYERTEIPERVTFQFFTDKIHPDDYKNTMDAMKAHLYGRSPVYEVEYRIQTKDGGYRWYYDRGAITQYDAAGKPLFLAGVVFDVTEKKEKQAELERRNSMLAQLAAIDGLTNIANQRALIDYLKDAIANPQWKSIPLSIAFFDIDDFKKVNDTKGHLYGDKVLADVAAIIKRSIRDTDFAGRYGGEEFMVVFLNADLHAASSVAQRIRRSIEHELSNDEVSVTISGGVKQYEGESLSDFIRAADVCLYAAKMNGKNRIIS